MPDLLTRCQKCRKPLHTSAGIILADLYDTYTGACRCPRCKTPARIDPEILDKIHRQREQERNGCAA